MDNMSETVYYDQDEGQQGQAGLVIFDRRNKAEIVLLEKNTVTVGRQYPGAASDVCLESSIVSRNHGVFFFREDGWWYQDQNSTNGTFYNRTLLFHTNKSARLRNGDVLRVDSIDPSKRHKDSVIILFSEQCRKYDNWKSFRLGSSVMIGRGEDCSIAFPDADISKHHAEIRKDRKGQYWIQDLNSYNGTFVNGTEVMKWYRLQDRDVIMICNVRMIFAGNMILYRADGELGATQMGADYKNEKEMKKHFAAFRSKRE